jgi:pyrroline-5-carboxylate reductase
MLSGKNISVLGVGTIGSSLISGLLKSGMVKPNQIRGTVKHSDTIKTVQLRLDRQAGQGIRMSTDNIAAVKDADIVILSVKPQNMASLLETISTTLNKNQLVISVAAAVPLAYLEEHLSGQIPLIRAMPNTCVSVGTGMTGLTAGKYATENHKQIAQAIFKSVGEVVFLEEKLFNALTALSASGPAYLYVVIESLAEAGVKLGMPRETATLLAAQTMLGTAKMLLETGEHPALLKDAVTTPAGCTIDGLMELEEGKLRVTLIRAVIKAAERANELLKS